jgi:hypothetical protein
VTPSGTVHLDGESSSAGTLTFSAIGNGLVYQAKSPTSRLWETLQIRLNWTADTTTVVRDIEVIYTSDRRRRWAA